MQANIMLSAGTFAYIQNILKNTPEKNWKSKLKQLQPSNISKAEILPIHQILNDSELKLSSTNQKMLLNGKLITTTGLQTHYSYFLYYGKFETYALQRINNSNHILKINLSEPINQIIKDTMRWISHIILLELKNTPESQWDSKINQLQNNLKLPLELISAENSKITEKIRNDLEIYQTAFTLPSDSKTIKTLYFSTSNPEKILQIGPIENPQMTTLFSVEQDYYFIILAIVSIVIVIFLTWLFSRNIMIIFNITKKYSSGNFNQNNYKISKLSILHSTYQNILSMGNSLQKLMKTQKNMTRFVAHEIRTPLSTMQFAIDALNKNKNLSNSDNQKIASIQEDIFEINKLVSTFLLYQKTQSPELTLNLESFNLVSFLTNIIQKYNISNIDIIISPEIPDTLTITADPDLLKHVINNLLTNAIKAAKNKIFIDLNITSKFINIIIEDNGAGISASDKKTIFEPFSTLNTQENISKHIGLGLTIAKSIIELHHGKITVSESKKLGGAKFIIQLPAHNRLN